LEINSLQAIGPIDGRYADQTRILSPFFSEAALIRYRIKVEIEYFIALSGLLPELKSIPKGSDEILRSVYHNFTDADANQIKEIEKKTNHDVKAVEYFIKFKMEGMNLEKWKEFVHFGLTSQDINNTAIPLSLMDYLKDYHIPQLNEFLKQLDARCQTWEGLPMLARTHGQPASPTRLGKELDVFSARIKMQLELFKTIPYSAKFGGATGNFNAHVIAYPEIDWKKFSDEFISKGLGLSRSQPTTQIEHYDNLAAQFDNFKRINTILIDFCRDVWQYISMGYFTQKIKEGEVGSSAMPHKVNPIDFENAEGNLGIANALFEHLSAKLPISRLQRDLTDSTVLRNIGMPFAHTWIAMNSIRKGFDKLQLNRQALDADLEDNWAVIAEAIQTILRKEGYPDPYEALKSLTRKNEKITQQTMHDFIDSLEIKDEVRLKLKGITPFNYTGI
jgi:adenylosuccinate lyase